MRYIKCIIIIIITANYFLAFIPKGQFVDSGAKIVPKIKPFYWNVLYFSGWAPPEIKYNLRDSGDSSDDDIELSKLQSPSKKSSSPSKRGRPKRDQVNSEEKT